MTVGNPFIVRNPSNPKQWLFHLGRCFWLVFVLIVGAAAATDDWHSEAEPTWTVVHNFANYQRTYEHCTHLTVKEGFLMFRTKEGQHAWVSGQVLAFQELPQAESPER